MPAFLIKIIDDLIVHHPKIQSIYLFGSRAYRTNSMRSDIDILVITEGILAMSDVNSWLHDKYISSGGKRYYDVSIYDIERQYRNYTF